MGKRTKKRSRNQKIILAFITVAVLAVVAEAGYLIYLFTKKKPETKPEKPVITETPTPTVPQQEDEPEGRYVISKEYGWHYNEAIGRNGEFCIEYEYDKQGRETVSRTLDGEDVLVTYVTTYDRNGSKTEEWDPDCDGYLMRRLYLDQSGTVVRTLYQNIDGTGLEECEEEFDTAGNRIALKYVSDSGTTYYIRWEYDQLGRMIKRSESDDSDGAEKVYNYHEFLYDEENRIIRDTEYSKCMRTVDMINGITVTLYTKTKTGTDGFGDPVYTETAVEVDDVLVYPSTGTEILETVNLYGKKAVYSTKKKISFGFRVLNI